MIDPKQELSEVGMLWPDGSMFEADFFAGPGHQSYEWPEVGRFDAEDTDQNESSEKKHLSLEELTPEPDSNLWMQHFNQGGFQEFHPQGLGSEMFAEMDMSAFSAFFNMQAQVPDFRAWNRRGNQRDEAWQRDRDRWYPRKTWYEPLSRDDPPYKATKAGKELRTLLEFYFEPFNLQHNKFMLDLIMTKVGTPRQALVTKNMLAEIRLDLEELKGLNRISNGLERLDYGNCKIVALDDPEGAGFKVQRRWVKPDGPAAEFRTENFRFASSDQFLVRKLAEVRGFLVREGVDVEGLMARFLSSPSDMVQAPKNKFTVVSLNCTLLEERSVPEEALQATEGRIKRQILLYHPDIICIQGLDPWQGPVGFGLASSLMELGYHVAAHAGEANEANTVFYHETRFELMSAVKGLAAADLKFLEGQGGTVRAACIRAEVPPSTDLEKLLDHEAKATVIVADCLPIGGAEVVHIVQELSELRSAYREFVKEEPCAPVAAWDPLDGCQRPVQTGASGLLKLHRPDCILFGGGVDAIAALAGHSATYVATLSPEEASSQFPMLRMPLLSVFQWT